ncbi:MAG TPA: hypothetical protein VJ719_11755 [Chthoniobacterales bacterium]|nr:hypothetical protein [Chthoniobacterales bacterium]
MNYAIGYVLRFAPVIVVAVVALQPALAAATPSPTPTVSAAPPAATSVAPATAPTAAAPAATASGAPASPQPTLEEEKQKGYLPYHQLTVEDFPIDDKTHPGAAWWVKPFIHPRYNPNPTNPRPGAYFVYVADWAIYSGFDRNKSFRSSKFKEMKSALPYAQALLDINEIYARKLAALQPAELPRGQGRTQAEATKDLENQLADIVNSRLLEMKEEMDALGTATKNGEDKKKLAEMAADIKKRLDALPPPSPPATVGQPASSPAGNPPTASAPNPSSSP